MGVPPKPEEVSIEQAISGIVLLKEQLPKDDDGQIRHEIFHPAKPLPLGFEHEPQPQRLTHRRYKLTPVHHADGTDFKYVEDSEYFVDMT